jgi:hypothetical protein
MHPGAHYTGIFYREGEWSRPLHGHFVTERGRLDSGAQGTKQIFFIERGRMLFFREVDWIYCMCMICIFCTS